MTGTRTYFKFTHNQFLSYVEKCATDWYFQIARYKKVLAEINIITHLNTQEMKQNMKFF